MHKSENKSLITRRIMQVAKRIPVFRRVDLVNAYFAEHSTDLWQERLDSLVSRGKLYAKTIAVHGDETYYTEHYSLKPF